MPKNIRQTISRAIQRTLKKTSCCYVKKSKSSYQPKQTSTKDDYIDLSECYSFNDLGIYVNANEVCQPLESTKVYSDDSSLFSNLSTIAHVDLGVAIQPSTIECCRCQCHDFMNNKQLIRYSFIRPRQKIYPFIF